MSTATPVSSQSTRDEEAENWINAAAKISQADEAYCQKETEMMTQQKSQVPYNVSGVVTEVMTMEDAVRVPQALQAATRRTMVDVLSQLRRQKENNAMNSSEARLAVKPPHDRQTERDRNAFLIPMNEAKSSLLPDTTTQMGTDNTNILQTDLSRSLRHLLPSHRAFQEELEQQREESIDEDSIYDSDNDNNVDGCPRQQPPQRSSLEGSTDAVRSSQRRSWTLTVSDGNSRRNTEHQRNWAKLFDCDDPHQDEPNSHECQATVLPAAKDIPAPRNSTKSSRVSGRSFQSFWTEAEDEPRRTMGSRASLATLLNEAEARDDEACAQRLTAASDFSNGDERLRQFTDVLVAEETEDSRMPSTHSIGKPKFLTRLPTGGGGGAASVPTAFAVLQGSTRRTGGRGGTGAMIKQLSENPTSARVVSYLTRSFEDWKLDAAIIRRANEQEETHEPPSGDPSLLESSGVQLKLLVKVVENAFSLYSVRCEVVWADAQTAEELARGAYVDDDSTQPIRKEQQEVMEEGVGCRVSNAPITWTVVMTTAAFRSTPIVVGKHLYLARPFFCYPAIRAIVASLNITSDDAVQKAYPNSSHRQRRSREADSSEANTGGRAESGEPCGEMSVSATTPERITWPAASLSGPSPFKAYDPFVNPPTNLFRKNTAASGSSVTLSQGNMQRMGSTPRKTTVHLEEIDARGQTEASRQHVVSSDQMGANFPRGPGDEWDVPLEVLLALCPPRKRRGGSSEPATGVNETDNPSLSAGGAGEVRNGVSSTLSSVSSVDAEGYSPYLRPRPEEESRCDRVLLSD